MADTKKRSILKNVLGGIKNAAGTVGDTLYTMKNNAKTFGMNQTLANKMMDKEYPYEGVAGAYSWKKRKAETLKDINAGNMSGARKKLQGITAKFEQDNPEYNHKYVKKYDKR